MAMTISLVAFCSSDTATNDLLASSLSADLGVDIHSVLEVPEFIPIAAKKTENGQVSLPDPDLGRHLESPADVRAWLGHPSNQKKTQLFIIGWNGHVPWIADHYVSQLARDGFCGVVIREQKNRKHRPSLVEDLSNQTED